MPKLRVHNFAMSIDRYVTGPDQSRENPLGVRGEELHEWIFTTRTGLGMMGQEGGSDGIDDERAALGETNIGAMIMGRNMYGPIRGEWSKEDWKGWWGDNPPFHHPVFVLTHHPHSPITMDGGTTFNFVCDGIEAALEQAFKAAQGKDVRLGGGASTVQQYLRAQLIDDLHLAIVPILLGTGERLFDGLASIPDGYECVEFVSSPAIAHVHLARKNRQETAKSVN